MHDEDDLLLRACSGDLDAFNAIVERYQALVYNVCLRMLGESAAAEDATQDTFIAAYRGLGRFRGGSFRAWLLRIAANACYDELRRRRRRPLPLEAAASVAAPSQASPLQAYLEGELAQEIQRGLLRLPPDQRLAVVLRDVEGLSYEEIARAMGTSLGTVKSRIGRGRARLREHLTAAGLVPLAAWAGEE
ncbi:MAG TPA: sigma-70 family RNA polymerase sigma factor [Dehalococcoidia bacterium]|nr:sigma-70 family RNA polymerase sigma factor [Dehalococcoidia bacterium]